MNRTYDKHGNILTYSNSSGYSSECTRDANGNILTFSDSKGYSYEYTRDANGNELTYSNSEGFSYKYTRDANGNELTFSNSSGYSYEYTRDADGNILTCSDSDGLNRVAIAIDPEYTLYHDINTKLFTAGCRENLTLEKALDHWNREDARAKLFTKALKAL
jgi:YD repeat-containing protein